MKIAVDTKEDSHEDIRKVIKMLQNLVGDAQEVFTNEPELTQESASSPIANIFGDTSNLTQESTIAPETTQEAKEETSESTEDLFKELFSEDELEKMKESETKEENVIKPKDKKHDIELY